MKTKKAPLFFSIGRISCSVFGHSYRVSKPITDHIKEYRCRLCGEEVTNTADGTIAKLTAQFKETNEYLAEFYQKRTRCRYSEAS